MNAQTRDLTTGKPLPLLVSFSLPLMIGNVFQQMYTVVDTAVVGKALGVGALAALGAADWLNWMMLGVIQGLTQGFGIMMAQNRRLSGAFRHQRVGAGGFGAGGGGSHSGTSANAGRHQGEYGAVSSNHVWRCSHCHGL